jgi:hypothetical protein
MKLATLSILVAAALSIFTATAPATTPQPTESHGCNGNIVAELNHNSGIFGASGNPKSSAGPGYFLKTGTAEAVHAVREEFCP